MNDDLEIDMNVNDLPDDLAAYIQTTETLKKEIRLERASTVFQWGSFYWHQNEHGSVLPDDSRNIISDLLITAYGLDFSKMKQNTRTTLWKGVRFYYGLSESDFPYPEHLRETESVASSSSPDPLARPARMVRHKTPLFALVTVVIIGFAGGFLVGQVVPPGHPPTNPPIPYSTAHFLAGLPHASESSARPIKATDIARSTQSEKVESVPVLNSHQNTQ